MSGAKTSAAKRAPARQDAPPRDATPATVEQITVIKHELERYSKVVTRLLARTDISADEFTSWVANALRDSPNGALWKCVPETVVGAALRCAQLNLPPNDGSNLAWIIPYGGKAQFQLGYGGVLALAERACPGLRFDGRPVYPGDAFDLDYGRQPPLKHKPYHSRRPPRAKGGDAVLWYVRATYPDGHEYVHALDRDGVEYHRGFSRMANGDAWSKSYDSMALKSVVLDMRRWLPRSQPLQRAIAADGAVIDVRAMNAEAPELPTPAEHELGAGQTADDAVIDGEIVDDEAPTDPEDAAWIAQAKATPTGDQP